MHIHDEVLAAALRLAGERGDWSFTPDEIVRALPHLNPSSIRTHVTSRCCVNAPKNHLHKWDYFRRVGRGKYVVLPAMRPAGKSRKSPLRVAEARAVYRAKEPLLRETIHSVVSRSGAYFVAECLEVAVVTQGHTLDETMANLKDALALHLDGEDLTALGLVPAPRLVVTHETSIR